MEHIHLTPDAGIQHDQIHWAGVRLDRLHRLEQRLRPADVGRYALTSPGAVVATSASNSLPGR
jgi:hypothetical protein